MICNTPEDPTEHRGDCKEGWEAYGDSCFFFSEEKRTWFDAEAVCMEAGAHLTSCIDGTDFEFLRNYDTARTTRWIGYDDL